MSITATNPIAVDENGTPTLLLSAPNAAKALGMSQKLLWSLSAPRGTIPVVRIGVRGVRYSVADLQAWIAEQSTQNPGSACRPQQTK
jgi:predicted DNA-binding transcriptional regulator AlpA